MASLDRSAPQQGIKKSYDELNQTNAQSHVLDVAPLTVVPFSGSLPKSPTNNTSASMETEAKVVQNETAMVFHSLRQTGNVANAMAGPIIGLVDIGESDDSYIFRVSLPGVLTDHDNFSCRVNPSGEITIEGVTATGKKTVHKKYHKFEMISGNLCPPGNFSISFQLPGPVDEYQFSGRFGIDGIFEGIVKKI